MSMAWKSLSRGSRQDKIVTRLYSVEPLDMAQLSSANTGWHQTKITMHSHAPSSSAKKAMK